jgi:hypothetical protein
MGTYQLGCEFDIVRRIDWTDEELGEHIDTVFDRLHQAEGVQSVEAEANLDSGRTTLSMTLSTLDDDPRHIACGVLGVAIRSCGGDHVGLLPLGEEAVVKPYRNSWSGLRTPTWRIRQIDISDELPV